MIRKLNQALQKARSGPMCCGKKAWSKPRDTGSLGFYFFIIDTISSLPRFWRGPEETTQKPRQHRFPSQGWGGAWHSGSTALESLTHQVLTAGACLHSTLWQVPLRPMVPAPMTALWTHLLLGNWQGLLRISTDKRMTTDFPSTRPRSGNRPNSYPISIFPLYSHKATTTAMGS